YLPPLEIRDCSWNSAFVLQLYNENSIARVRHVELLRSRRTCYNACQIDPCGKRSAMLDQIDLERRIEKHEYKTRRRELQTRMYDLQQALFEARRPALIVFEGWAGTSKIGTITQLTRRLDPRGVRVHSITPPRTYETMYPWLYRFWLKIPSY